MEMFKGSHQRWFVLVFSTKERNKLFSCISKRDPICRYYFPDGTKGWQYEISTKEADKINEQIN